MSEKKDTQQNNLEYAELSALLSSSEDAVSTKIELLKEALKNETYTINSERIAAQMLEQTEPEETPSEQAEFA